MRTRPPNNDFKIAKPVGKGGEDASTLKALQMIRAMWRSPIPMRPAPPVSSFPALAASNRRRQFVQGVVLV